MERKADISAIDFDTLFEDISPDHADLLKSSLAESSLRFRLFVQNFERATQKVEHCDATTSSRSVGSDVMQFGCCPPPLRASLASFDDQVIKYLGDRGGPDEQLWTSLQSIHIPKPSHVKAQFFPGRNLHGSVSNEAEINSQGAPQNVEGDCSPRPQEAQSQESFDGPNGTKSRPKSPHSPRGERPSTSVSIHTEAIPTSVPQADNGATPAVDSTIESTRALALQYHADLLAALKAPTSSSRANAATKSAESGSGNELWDQIASVVGNGSTIESYTSTTGTHLGKRGRYFLDIWDEEEFISKIKTKTRLCALNSWQDLFHDHYSDNHDGCYRDWLVGQQMDTKGRLLDNKHNKKKRPSDPIFWTNVVVPNDTSELAGIVPPPVPVAIHHPAAWGIRKQEVLIKGQPSSKYIDTAVIHPASCSHKAILPMHSKPTSHVSHISSVTSIDASFAAGEDVDDFNVYADRLDQQLVLEEASNFVRLSRLQSILSMRENALKLGVKRRRLEDLVYSAIRRMEPSSSDRVLYAFKPTKSSQSIQTFGQTQTQAEKQGVLRVDLTGKEIPRRPSDNSLLAGASQLSSNGRYNTRCGFTSAITDITTGAASARLDPGAKFRRDLLGACAARQVQYASALAQCLQVGQEIEVLIDKRWQVGTICRLVCDGDHIRHVKIEPLDCICEQSVWVAVEDGKIAPCGTHLRPTKAAGAAAAVPMKPSVSFSSLPSSTNTPEAVSTEQVQTLNGSHSGASFPVAVGAVQAKEATPPTANRVTPAGEPLIRPSSDAPQPIYYAFTAPALAYGQFPNGVPYQHGALNYPAADFAAMFANGAHLPPVPNGFHPASYIAVAGPDGVKVSAAIADPRVQKKQCATSSDLMLPTNGTYSNGSANGRPPSNLTTPSIPVRNGSFPYPVGNAALVAAKQTGAPDNRVKIPLPLGATDPRELIPVNSYNNAMTYMAQAPPPHLYGYNRSVQHSIQHPPSSARVSYEYTIAGTTGSNHAVTDGPHNHMSYDSVGFHSFDTTQPSQVAAVLPQAISALGATNNHNNAPPPTGTFRLGPRGSITKN